MLHHLCLLYSGWTVPWSFSISPQTQPEVCPPRPVAAAPALNLPPCVLYESCNTAILRRVGCNVNYSIRLCFIVSGSSCNGGSSMQSISVVIIFNVFEDLTGSFVVGSKDLIDWKTVRLQAACRTVRVAFS